MAGIQKIRQKLVDRAYYLSSPAFRLEEPSGNSLVREHVESGSDETAASKMRHEEVAALRASMFIAFLPTG